MEAEVFTVKMQPIKTLEDHLDYFNKVILDLENIKVKVDVKDQALLILKPLPSEYDILANTLIYGRYYVTLEEVQNALVSKEIQIMLRL